MKKILISFLLCVSVAAFAQEDFTVTVTDYESNQPISELSIQLTNDARGLSFEQTTSSQGKVIFKSIPALDGYQVFFEGNDLYGPAFTEKVDVRSNQSPSIQLRLAPSLGNEQQLEEITLSNTTSAKINRRDAEVSFELKAEEIEEIPVEARDVTRVLYRLPNVTQATGFFPEAANVSINGGNPLFTSYLIDNLDNNENFLGGQRFAIPSGFVKDITVLTSNYSAEYGLTSNGIIDITTKSGTNNLTGEVFFITRPGPSIDGKSEFAQRDLSGNQVKDGFARYQAGFGVGGALVEDKTFFYLNFEHTTDVKDNLLNVPELGVSETVRGENNFEYFSAKIDQKWNSNVRSSLRANVGLVGIERQGGGLDGGATFQSAGNKQERNSLNLALKNSYTIGAISGESNIQYSRFKWGYATPNNPESPQVVVRDPLQQTIAVLGHPGYVFDENESTLQFQQKFKYYLDNHTLKAGLNFITSDHELFGGGNPNGNYTVELTQTQLEALQARNLNAGFDINDLPSDVSVVNYNVELRPTSFGKTHNISSFYVEDLWAASEDLNITFGLRYDYDNLSKGGSDKGDYNNLAPRFNFNYQLTNNSVIRGGYGIAYDKISYAIYSDALQQNTTSDDYRAQIQELVNQGILPADTDIDKVTFAGNISANVANVDYLQGPSGASLQDQREGVFSNERRILNPNGYQNPYSHQFSIGYQLQVENDKLFFVDVFHNRGEKLFRLRNLNAAATFPIDENFDASNVRSIEEADSTRPIPIVNGVGIINGQEVSGVARNVIVSETEGKSRYYAASFNYQKTKGMDNYSYRLNYTLSSLENDTEDINFRPQDANNYANEYGPSINDRRHNINGIFNYYPFKGTSVTLASLLQSGQPINRIPDASIYGTTDLNGDGSGFGDAYVGNSDRSPGESRNSDRLPWSFNFDLGVQHQFAIGTASKIEIRADIFNVFNVENLSGYSNNSTQSNQIQVGPASSGVFVQRNAGPPRQFQFGARYLF
ncbi:TonB-dependent receptor plug domain-containing protein [Ulvibacter litoralis]|uniref:TonB-dependent Receptor Plug Domain n=1 Tax=Ulvibacter litoralis TaxID=227084 RepID=A0A1G7CGU3_9FLAO|nr:TonB-dependent receptor [Ulvibacter litoralis]GHC47396.1 TonB-dependent receptor [Ulvibacter litoralis]SDE38557.1 TonB-dependent Receptor Plug Domain [Ulvibacter litoralis]